MKANLLLSFIMVVAGCNSSGFENKSADFEDIAEVADEEMPESEVYESVSLKRMEKPRETKIIKWAEVSYKVSAVDSISDLIEELAVKRGGRLHSGNMTTATSEIRNDMVIKVPNQNFEVLMDDLLQFSLFTDYKRVNSKDVTEEFIDIQSRLKTKREVKKRMDEVLRNKASNVEEILMAEDRIRVIQEEIEAQEGRLKYLSEHVSMSTINLQIYQELDYVKQPLIVRRAFSSQLYESFQNGWSIVKGTTLGVVTIWPLWVLGIAVVLGRKKWRNAVFKR